MPPSQEGEVPGVLNIFGIYTLAHTGWETANKFCMLVILDVRKILQGRPQLLMRDLLAVANVRVTHGAYILLLLCDVVCSFPEQRWMRIYSDSWWKSRTAHALHQTDFGQIPNNFVGDDLQVMTIINKKARVVSGDAHRRRHPNLNPWPFKTQNH